MRRTRDDRVADLERAALHQDGGYRSATLVQVCLNGHALSIHIGIGSQVEGSVCRQDDRFQQRVQALAGDRGDVDEHGVAAILLRHQAVLGQLATNLRRIGTHFVDLVHCHDHRHFGCQGMVQRLNGLWHHTVIGRNHQHGDIGRLRPTGAHRGERFVTRGVDEGDLALLVVHLGGHLVRTNRLGNATRLAGHHVGLADRIEQLGLAMVNVTHHGDDWRARRKILLAAGVLPELDVEALQQLAILVLGRDNLDVVVELGTQHLEGVTAH